MIKMDNQTNNRVRMSNFNLILCERVEMYDEKQSFIGIFDEIQVDNTMKAKFSAVIVYEIFFPEEFEDKSPIYKMQLSINFLKTKEGTRGNKTLPIKTFDLPTDEGACDSATKRMLAGGDEDGLVGICGVFVFDISTVFIGEGQYQFALRGKEVLCNQVTEPSTDMQIVALKPFSVTKKD